MLALSLRFDGGATATTCCGRLLPDSRNDFTVYGSHGRITGVATLWEARQGRLEVVSETVNEVAVYLYDYLANFVAELVDFHRAIEEDREPVATGIDGLRMVQVALAMIQSAKEGRTVKIAPVQA